MTVYVDTMKLPYKQMIMSHMTADTLEELHAMADKIGLKRKWFQQQGGHPHYDVSQSKKKLAIDAGAILVEQRELLKIAKLLGEETP